MGTPEKNQGVTLQFARTLVGIGNDHEYDSLLTDRKHLASLAAPEPFRRLLKNLNPFRFSLEAGIEQEGAALHFVWFIGEFGSDGNPEQVLARISASLSTSGFTALPQETAESGFPRYRYVRNGMATRDQVILEGPERFVGTKTDRSGGTITYRATLNRPAAGMTYDEVLLAFPAFRCQTADGELADRFSGKRVARAGFGGTWERYYDWTFVFLFPDQPVADGFFQEIKSILIKNGFTEERRDRGIITFMKKTAHEPVFYLEKENETLVSVRIQPHT